MSIFKLQSLITISLETSYTLLGSASVKRILYAKPDGTDGFWTASVSGTKLTYGLANGDIDQAGVWKFQAYIEAGGLKGYGEIVEQEIELPLDQD